MSASCTCSDLRQFCITQIGCMDTVDKVLLKVIKNEHTGAVNINEFFYRTKGILDLGHAMV